MDASGQHQQHAKLTRADAARLNGAKSRGPRTPEGKPRSTRNAIRHGLAAETFALLPGENAEAFAALRAGLADRYRPRDALAEHLVERLASVMWRQRRADRLEAEVLSQRERRPDKSYIGGYVPGSPERWDAARFSAVQRQQARLDRAMFKLMAELDRLTPADDDELPPGDVQEVPNEPERPPARPSSTDILPLTPELAALLRDRPHDEEAGRLFAAGRIKQVNDFLCAKGRRPVASG